MSNSTVSDGCDPDFETCPIARISSNDEDTYLEEGDGRTSMLTLIILYYI